MSFRLRIRISITRTPRVEISGSVCGVCNNNRLIITVYIRDRYGIIKCTSLTVALGPGKVEIRYIREYEYNIRRTNKKSLFDEKLFKLERTFYTGNKTQLKLTFKIPMKNIKRRRDVSKRRGHGCLLLYLFERCTTVRPKTP